MQHQQKDSWHQQMRYTDTNICQIYVHTNISKTYVGVTALDCSRTPTLTFFMLVSGMLVCQWWLVGVVCWCHNAYVGVRNVGVRKYMLVSKLGRWLPTAVIYRHDESMHGVWFLSLWAAVCHASGWLWLRQTQFCPVTRIRRGRFSGCHGSMSKIQASDIEILMAAQISPCRAQKASHGNVGVV